MINLVLDDLRCPAGKGFDAGLELFVLPFDFNSLITLARAWTAKEGQAAFLSVIRSGHLDNLRIEHGHICALVIKDDDSLTHANHICCHTHTGFFVCSQRIQQILRNLLVIQCRQLRFPCQQYWVVYYLSDHLHTSFCVSSIASLQ